MKLETHVLKAIEANDRGDKDDALLHATIAINATARKLFNDGGNQSYKKCIRQYYWIIERFIGEGLNLTKTRWTHLDLDNGHGKKIPEPDLADIIYHVFRCNDAHATEIPISFEILPSKSGYYEWHIDIVNKGVRMPDTIIWALLAVSIFSYVNSDITTEGEHWLSWGNDTIGNTTFIVKDHWGKEDELRSFFLDKPTLSVIIENL